jgi:hypothetical protein
VIGVQRLINKLWVKFNEEGVECICNEYARKCDEPTCKEYVVKFTEIERSNYRIDNTNKSINEMVKSLKKIREDMRKGINKFKI